MNLSHIEKPLVFFHGSPASPDDGCLDGFCAAFLAKQRWPDAELVPVNYGTSTVASSDSDETCLLLRSTTAGPTIDLVDRDVLVLDFSFPREQLLGLRKHARSLLVLDHHKSAEEDLRRLDFCVFDMNRSGAGLALDYFFPGSREWLASKDKPSGVKGRAPIWLTQIALTVEDRDTWSFKRKGTKEIAAFLDTRPRSTKAWLSLPCPKDMEDAGRAILAYQDRMVSRIAAHAREIPGKPDAVIALGEFGTPCRFPAVNSPVLQSEVGEVLAKRSQSKAALVYYFSEDHSIRGSFRSTADGPDVSAWAKALGGGGHAKAAGFRLGIDDPRYREFVGALGV